jgi:hypothetical protein
MLRIPYRGFHPSATKHNVAIDSCCDWLEASALFLKERLSASNVIACLHQNNIYHEQDFAWEFKANVWNHLRMRAQLVGKGYPLKILDDSLSARDGWTDFVPYSFCLALSLGELYPTWKETFGADYTEQGELFEALTEESLKGSFSGWTVHPTGWTRTNKSQLASVVEKVASVLGESTWDLSSESLKAHEAGLDLLCSRSFPDGRVGVPTYLFQCASGSDWKGKLHMPSLNVWKNLIRFATAPKKAFSIPFALLDSEFRQSCVRVDGFFLDRNRLLAPGRKSKDWITEDIAKRIVKWARPRIVALRDFTDAA